MRFNQPVQKKKTKTTTNTSEASLLLSRSRSNGELLDVFVFLIHCLREGLLKHVGFFFSGLRRGATGTVVALLALDVCLS